MNKKGIRFAALASAALVSGLSARASFSWDSFSGTSLVVPAGETVVATEAQVATLNALAAIEIPATSELIIQNTTTHVTLAAAVTGAGKLSFDTVKTLNLSGDNYGFTGEIASRATDLHVQNVKALGKGNTFTHYLAADTKSLGKLYFDAAGNFTNAFHFVAEGARGYVVQCTATGGDVRLCGSIQTTGPVEFVSSSSTYLRLACDLTHVSGATPKFFRGSYPCPNATLIDLGADGDLNLEQSSVYANSGSPSYLRVNCRNVVLGANMCWYSMTDGTIPAMASLILGSDTVPKGGSTLGSGSWFVSNVCYRSEINASNVKTTTSSFARPLTIRGCGPDFGLYAQFKPGASITLDSKTATPGTLLLTNPNNTMTGKITAKRGTIAIDEDARFTAVTNWYASGDGVIEIRNPASIDAAGAILNLTGSQSGVLRVPKGVNLTVYQVYVKNSKLAPSTYNAVSAPFRMEGEGTLTVTDGYVPTKYERVWKNTSGDDDFYNDANWSRTGAFNGSQTFNFSAGNLDVAEEDTVFVLTNDVMFGGAVFKRNKRLTFRGKTGKERVIFNDCGGVSFLCKDTNGQVYTNVFEVPVVFTPKFGAAKSVLIYDHVRVEFKGGLQGGENATTITMSGNSYVGEVSFEGDGALLASPLEVKEMRAGSVSHPRGLGATNRFTTVRKSTNRLFTFKGTGDAVTNETPLRIYASDRWGDNNDPAALNDATTFTGDPAVPFVQKGAMRFVGSSAESLRISLGNCTFLDGVSSEGTDPIRFYNRANRTVNVCGKPLDFSGSAFYSIGNGMTIYNLEQPGGKWDSFTLSQMRLVAGAAGVLDPDGALVFCDHDVYPKGVIDLNGHDQAARSVRNGDSVTITQATAGAYGVVESASPATLTLTPTSVLAAAAMAFTNHVSLVMNGTADSAQTFTHKYSDTDGSLTLNGGTLTFQWGAGWGGTNVAVHAGTLAIGAGSGAVAFGQTTKADLVIDGTGKLEIAEGERAVVGAVTVNGVALTRGTWGGPESSAADNHRSAALAGKGCIKVTKGDSDGTLLILR